MCGRFLVIIFQLHYLDYYVHRIEVHVHKEVVVISNTCGVKNGIQNETKSNLLCIYFFNFFE